MGGGEGVRGVRGVRALVGNTPCLPRNVIKFHFITNLITDKVIIVQAK